MNPPDYNLDKIKFGVDAPTFEKAVKLYESGKVTEVEEGVRSYSGIVLGTEPYRVYVEARRFNLGDCTCYLGKKEILCKHLVALAIYVVKNGKPLTEEDKKMIHDPFCSGKPGELTEKELEIAKTEINKSLRYIKPYRGPSRLWFSYQNSLSEGCNRLSAIVSKLPVSEQMAEIMVDLLLRLDRKLQIGGVDDSDGTVGGFIEKTVIVLSEFTKLDPKCVRAFSKLKNKETCFGWEEPLLNI